MIRTKGEPGTGDVIEAVKHMRALNEEIRRIHGAASDELFNISKEIGAPYDLVERKSVV